MVPSVITGACAISGYSILLFFYHTGVLGKYSSAQHIRTHEESKTHDCIVCNTDDRPSIVLNEAAFVAVVVCRRKRRFDTSCILTACHNMRFYC